MKTCINHMEVEGLKLLDIVEEVNCGLYNLTRMIHPGVPTYLLQELKKLRAKLIPYAQAIKEYGERDVGGQ